MSTVPSIPSAEARTGRTAVMFHRPVLLLVLLMMAVAMGVGTTTLSILYRTAFDEERQRLLETARCETSLIEAVAHFIRDTARGDSPSTADVLIFSIIQDAHLRYERADADTDIIVAQRRGHEVAFYFGHREGLPNPVSIPFDSPLPEPLRRALSGQSGTFIGPDFRGIEVLSAYASVPTLRLGVIAQIDLWAIRAPFWRAGGIAGGIALALIAVGTFLLLRITRPVLRRLAESEARFRGISSVAQDAIIVMDNDGGVVFWNDAAECLFGYRREEAIGRTVADLIVPERYRARHEAGVERFRNTGEGTMVGQTSEVEARAKAGDEIPIEISLAGWRFGSTWHAVANIRDISQRKAAEREAQQRQQLLSQIIENIPHAVFWKDRESVYLGCNRRFAVHAGFEKPSEILGKTDYDLPGTGPKRSSIAPSTAASSKPASPA